MQWTLKQHCKLPPEIAIEISEYCPNAVGKTYHCMRDSWINKKTTCLSNSGVLARYRHSIYFFRRLDC